MLTKCDASKDKLSRTYSARYFVVTTTIAVALCFAASSPAGAVTFMGLGTLPGKLHSSASALSDDGTTVVGGSFNSNQPGAPTGNEAVRWRAGTGMVSLGGGNLTVGGASDVSADGSVVVGAGVPAGEIFSRGFINGAYLPHPGSQFSNASGVSADGSVVVGNFGEGATNRAAARWTGPLFAAEVLTDINQGTYQATAVSGDGSVVVGVAGFGSLEAVILLGSNNVLGLGDLPGGATRSVAFDVSFDGSVVVGEGQHAVLNKQAFRWTPAGGMQALIDLTGDTLPSGSIIGETTAFAVSADGSVIVGSLFDSDRARNFPMIWDAVNGMRAIDDILTAGGVDLTGWTLTDAVGVTGAGLLTETGIPFGDGLTTDEWVVVGNGIHNGNAEAWYATISATALVPEPGSAALLALGGLLLARTRRRAT